MKNLKTVIILIVVLLCTQAVVAQMAKPTFIIKGAISSASFIWEDDYDTYADAGDRDRKSVV